MLSLVHGKYVEKLSVSYSWGISSFGRASGLQPEGEGIEALMLHVVATDVWIVAFSFGHTKNDNPSKEKTAQRLSVKD